MIVDCESTELENSRRQSSEYLERSMEPLDFCSLSLQEYLSKGFLGWHKYLGSSELGLGTAWRLVYEVRSTGSNQENIIGKNIIINGKQQKSQLIAS